MSSRWIKIHGSIEDWEWIDNPVMFYFWVRILLMANWEDRRWRGELIERGSFVTTLSNLSGKLNLSVQQVRTCLERLRDGGEINTRSTNTHTIITICKYDDYQPQITNEQQTNNKRVTNEQQTSNKEDNNNTSDTKVSSDYNYQERKKETNTRVREGNPSENWRHLSSARLDFLRVQGIPVADFKRSLLLAEVNSVAGELGLTRTDIDAFMQKWGESSPGSDMIRAEYEPTFSVRERAKNYKGVGKPVSRGRTVQELMNS